MDQELQSFQWIVGVLHTHTCLQWNSFLFYSIHSRIYWQAPRTETKTKTNSSAGARTLTQYAMNVLFNTACHAPRTPSTLYDSRPSWGDRHGSAPPALIQTNCHQSRTAH
jgi:hypothetical protein